MWLLLLKRLQSIFNEHHVAGRVELGAIEPNIATVDVDGSLFIVRGYEERGQEKLADELLVTVYIEAWTRADSAEIEHGYQVLSDLENRIEKALIDLRKACNALEVEQCMLDDRWQIVDLAVSQKVGGQASQRPLLGTQYTIVARMYDATSEEGIY